MPGDAPNIADWMSAIGTTGAVIYTAGIYALDRRRARRAEAKADRDREIARHDIATEALRLSDEGVEMLSEYKTLNTLNPNSAQRKNEKLRMDIGRIMRRLNELRGIATSTPQLFSFIGQLSDNFGMIDSVTVETNPASVAIDCQKAINGVKQSQTFIRSFIVPGSIQGRGTHHDTLRVEGTSPSDNPGGSPTPTE